METTLSNVVGFTMKKRARVTVKTPVLPSGTAGVGIYLAKGATKPSTAAVSMTSQGSALGSPPSKLIKVATFSPANNPTVNGFGSGVPAVIQSDDGASVVLKADGSWTLAGLGSHVAGGTTTTMFDSGWVTSLAAASGYTKVFAKWRRVGVQVLLWFTVQPNTAISYSTNGNVTGDPPLLAALPSNIWPSENVEVGISTGGKGGLAYVNNADGVTRLQAVDGYGTASTIAAASNISGLATWFI